MHRSRTALTRVEQLDGGRETAFLLSGEGARGQFGLGQVRHQARKPELGSGPQIVQRSRPVTQVEARAAHAGVEFDDDIQCRPGAGSATAQPTAPGRQLIQTGEHRR